jgi:hypothetical protein
MTTKFTPQTAAMATASAVWRVGIGKPVWQGDDRSVQRNFVDDTRKIACMIHPHLRVAGRLA